MLNVKIQSSIVVLFNFKIFRTTILGVASKNIFVLPFFFFSCASLSGRKV